MINFVKIVVAVIMTIDNLCLQGEMEEGVIIRELFQPLILIMIDDVLIPIETVSRRNLFNLRIFIMQMA